MSIANIRNILSTKLTNSLKSSNYEELIEYVNDLSKLYPGEIRMVAISDEKSRCFDYAFGVKIGHKNAVRDIITKTNLIKEIKKQTNIEKGDIGIYFIDNIPVHAGVVIDQDKLKSKWDRGPIFFHNPLMAPTLYGSDIKYYKIIDYKEVIKFLSSYRIN